MPSAQRVNWAKFRVAVLCLVAAIILLVVVSLLSGGTLFQRKAKIYLYIPDATGLAAASPVRVDGIDVGTVDRVDLSGSSQPDRIIVVTMTVETSRLEQLPADSFAELNPYDMVGDQFVDITSGRSENHIPSGGELTFKAPAGMMKSVSLDQLEKQLRTVDEVLTGIEQGKSRVGQFILGDGFYNDLRKRTTELQRGLRAIASTTSDLGQALYSDRLYRQVREPLAQLDGTLARLQSGQGTAGQLLRDTAQYDQLQAGARDLRKTISDLRSSEFVASDQMYNEWNRAISALIQTVGQMNANPMLTTSETYDNLNGFARELRDTVKEFRQDPRKFLRLKF